MRSQSDREAWIRIRHEDEIPPDAPNNYNFGFRAAMGRLQATHPPIGRAFSALFRQIMFEPGHLSRQEREMVAAVTAAAQDCYYWTQSHAEFLRVEDGDAALVEAIKQRRWREVDGLSPRQYALCALAEKLSATPTRMVEADWHPLRDLGFDDQACLEVAHIVGIFNYLTRLADGFGLQLDAATQSASESGVALRRAASTAAG